MVILTTPFTTTVNNSKHQNMIIRREALKSLVPGGGISQALKNVNKQIVREQCKKNILFVLTTGTEMTSQILLYIIFFLTSTSNFRLF